MRKSNTQKLGEVIKEYLRSLKIDRKVKETGIINTWASVMGRSVSRRTKKIYIRKGIMYVHLDSPILRNELSYMKTRIKKRFNEDAGEEIIKDIVLR